MTTDRLRGVILYACATAVLLGGGTWWLRAAPHDQVDTRIPKWRDTAQRLLPMDDREETGDTLTLAAGADHEVVANLAGTSDYAISVICVGGDGSEARVRLGAQDSGRGLDCAGEGDIITFKVALAGQLRMTVSVGDAGPVVVRYSVSDAS